MAIHIKKSHEGLLHKNLGVSKKKTLSTAEVAVARRSPSAAIRKEAVFAQNAKKWNHK